jgi:hypothetical protein
MIHEKESHVCRLKKYLYSLKQAPWPGYARQLFDEIRGWFPLILYVDDLFLMRDEKTTYG